MPKGLAGAYNHNVLKLAEEQLADCKEQHLFVVGEVGRQYFHMKKIKVDLNVMKTQQVLSQVFEIFRNHPDIRQSVTIQRKM